MNCLECPKAVNNAIIHASHPRGFHKPAQKCEENLIIFLLKGEILVNSQEYAGTMIHAGEFILQAIGSKIEILALTEVKYLSWQMPNVCVIVLTNLSFFVKSVTITSCTM